MTDDPPLFPGFDPPEVEELSAGRRLTLRQHADVESGRHPLTRGPLHPEASRDVEPGPHSAPFTCGACRHRDPVGYPKCHLPGPDGKPMPSRTTHSAATDLRAWWPACPDFEAKP